MNTRFEIKVKDFELQIDSSYLSLNANDGIVRLKVALRDIAIAIEYLVSRFSVTKELTE